MALHGEVKNFGLAIAKWEIHTVGAGGPGETLFRWMYTDMRDAIPEHYEGQVSQEDGDSEELLIADMLLALSEAMLHRREALSRE